MFFCTMTYEEAIQYLYKCTPVFEHIGAKAYKPGLATTKALSEHFSFPYNKYKTIHVAGTNGKGSCSHTLAAILQMCGYRVGLYTSPHIIDFSERIKINGNCIDKQYVTNFITKERPFFEPLHPSFFELTTALAFKYFADKNIDIAVIEVGLGGRLDCTNVITPILSVITNISFDHMAFLGNTLKEIATEKAGIIKENVPVIIGERSIETDVVFIEKAKKAHAPLLFAEDERQILNYEFLASNGIIYDTLSFGKIKGQLGGLYQEKNTNTILCAANQLIKQGIITNNKSVKEGIEQVCSITGLVGRWQKVHSNPTVICDTGHNVAGWKYIVKQLNMQSFDKLRIVFGMVDDKDINTVMTMLPHSAIYYFTQAATHRAIPVGTIEQKAKENGLVGDSYDNVKNAFTAALSQANINDLIFVGGSSYIVSDFLSFYTTDT